MCACNFIRLHPMGLWFWRMLKRISNLYGESYWWMIVCEAMPAEGGKGECYTIPMVISVSTMDNHAHWCCSKQRIAISLLYTAFGICNISLKFETTGTLNTGVLWCKLKVLMKIPKYLLKMHFIQLLLSSSFIHWFLQTISLAAVDGHHGHYGLYLLEIQGIFPAVDSLQLHAKLHPNKLQFT